MFKIIITILKFFFFFILFLLINFIILIIINYKNFDLDEMFFDQCFLKKVFEKETVSGEHIFSSYGRDPTRVCSFLLSETENNLKNFGKIDEKYFENHHIKFAFENLDNFIEDKEKFYTKEEKETLKNIKNILKTWEKEEEIVYNFFKIYKDLEDFEVCYYKKSENKGYCIVQHI